MLSIFSCVLFIYLFCFLEPHLCHLEVPRPGVESELQLPAYTTAIATPDWSRVFDLHHSSWQHRILNPLRIARDHTHILMDTSRICFHRATMGTPKIGHFSIRKSSPPIPPFNEIENTSYIIFQRHQEKMITYSAT